MKFAWKYLPSLLAKSLSLVCKAVRDILIYHLYIASTPYYRYFIPPFHLEAITMQYNQKSDSVPLAIII